jgi:RNA polymerase sigma-70 factor (ECF subfamily)
MQREAQPVADTASARVDLARALRQLPPDQRDALMLIGWFGLTSEAAGRLLGIAAGSVRSRVARARATLAAALSDELSGDEDA